MILLISFGTSLGAQIDSWIQTENYLKPGTLKTINQELSPAAAGGDLNYIKLRFCNEVEKSGFTVDLSLQMRPWKRSEICIALENTSNKEINVILGFAEGKLAENGNMSCANDTTNNNKFSKRILYGPITWIVIPASGNSVQKVKYAALKNSSGDIFGCVVYKINQEEKIETGKMFLMVVRKIAPIHINITWNIYNYDRLDDMKDIYEYNNINILRFIIAILSLWLILSIIKTAKPHQKATKKK